eukprot:TRINITY_DN97625_c0_g1_i1.p1 TRINITY_DN97625_c0_g1~~TRINITY_DN97625_c0_g1_i1.p1  ORF type:complete len:258 (+),score=33.76 TRINITY_DN97625_c0_g1_i1:95-868(+)
MEVVKSGHSFADRLAAQKSRALERRSQQPTDVTSSHLPAGILPIDIAERAPVLNAAPKNFEPIQRQPTSQFKADGLSGSSKMADRFAAQKCRALARRGEQSKASRTAVAAGSTVPSYAKTAEVPGGSLGRNDFRPPNHRNGNQAQVAGRSGQEAELSRPAGENSPKDSLARLMKDHSTALFEESLEDSRRAVPGLCPDTETVPCTRSIQMTHGMPSQGRGGSNAFARGNAGNVLTDRPTSRVLKPPGGGSSFVIGKW